MGAFSDTDSNPSPVSLSGAPDHTPDPPATLKSPQLPRHTMPVIVGCFLYMLFLGLEDHPLAFLGQVRMRVNVTSLRSHRLGNGL